MSKFNATASASSSVMNHPAATVNHEGGLAFALDAKTRLYSRMATSLSGEAKFYQSGSEHDDFLREDIALFAETDPEFVLRLAAYVRHELHLRSVPQMILVEASRLPACKPFVRQWTPAIIQRADELTEVVAYWVSRYGAIGSQGTASGMPAFPNSLKRGLADAFLRFDEFQLVKYDREGSVKLRDVLRITHPCPDGDAQAALFKYLLSGELNEELLPVLAAKAQLLRKGEFDAEAQELARTSHATWEVMTSKFGSSKEIWEAVLPSMGYMAKLRNLRNFLNKGVDLEPVLAHLTNEQAIRHSKQLPFRFFSAYREVERLKQEPGAGSVLTALTRALDLSTVNLPCLPGKTLIAADNSGSMDNALSQKSSLRYADIANLMAAIAQTMCDDSLTGSFATDFALVSVDSNDSQITNMRKFAEADTNGWSTNAYRVVRWLRKGHHHVDRIVILSDMQCYDDEFSEGSLADELLEYRSSVNPDVFVHSVDLAGYGTSQFAPDCPKTALWAGWSERIFQAFLLAEEDQQKMVARIAEWSPRTGADRGEEPLSQ